MKRTTIPALTLPGALVAAEIALGAATMTLKGTVADAMCGAKHPVADAAGCTRDCVTKGSDYALIAIDGKVYTLKATSSANTELDKLAGKLAQVKGEVEGTTVTVQSVAMSK